MKRNMGPLIGIAVVVAIISTGVFYGLFAGRLRSASADVSGPPVVVAARDLDRGVVLQESDLRVAHFKTTLSGSFSSPQQLTGATVLAPVKQNEPFLEERVASKTTQPGESHGGGVPAGQRAVSIRVSESDSLMPGLKSGDKVDLQAVEERQGSLQLRTVLQNVEVLAVNPQPQPAGGNRGAVSSVTVLTRAEDADLVALADSGTRIRLALRNPLDEQTDRRRPLALKSLFQATDTSSILPSETHKTGLKAPDARPIQLHVEVLRATSAAASQLESKISHSGSGGSLSVAAFEAGTDGRELVQNLEKQGGLDLVLEKTLSASAGNPAKFRTGPESCQLQMHFTAVAGPGGRLNLRVRPEVSLHNGRGVETRVYESELPSSGSLLVTGILTEPRDRASLERLFPKHSWTDANLMILVTAQAAGQPDASTLARTHRGR
jgi:Flp pilus assembly protein CpaB